MITYTYSEARQQFSSVLDRAQSEGEVLIRRKDGQLFIIKPTQINDSPLDVEGISLGLSRDEIVAIQREIRER